MAKYMYVHLHHEYYCTGDLLEDYKACYTGSANHTIECGKIPVMYVNTCGFHVAVNLNLMMLRESYSPAKVLC